MTDEERRARRTARDVNWALIAGRRAIERDIKVMSPCPNHPEHDGVEIAFHDDEFSYTHYHCATDLGNGVVCHAEWDVDDEETQADA